MYRSYSLINTLCHNERENKDPSVARKIRRLLKRRERQAWKKEVSDAA